MGTEEGLYVAQINNDGKINVTIKNDRFTIFHIQYIGLDYSFTT